MNEREWKAYLADKFGALWERLNAENISYTTENTGGGCMVLVIRLANGSLVTITPSEKPNDDQRNHWMVCFSVDAEQRDSGDDETLDNCAHTERAMELIRERMAVNAIDTVALTAKRETLRVQFMDLIKAGYREEAMSINADIERIDALVC